MNTGKITGKNSKRKFSSISSSKIKDNKDYFLEKVNTNQFNYTLNIASKQSLRLLLRKKTFEISDLEIKHLKEFITANKNLPYLSAHLAIYCRITGCFAEALSWFGRELDICKELKLDATLVEKQIISTINEFVAIMKEDKRERSEFKKIVSEFLEFANNLLDKCIKKSGIRLCLQSVEGLLATA
jgi:hypothetical protein